MARPATGGRAARPQDTTAQADGRKVRCKSPKGRIVNRPPASFSRSRTATGGSARASTNAIRAASPPDGGSGPLDKAAFHPYAVLADRVSAVPDPASAPNTARSTGAGSRDRLHTRAMRPPSAAQPSRPRFHPVSVARSSTARMSSSSPGARNRGYSYPSGGRVRPLHGILRPRIPPNRPQNAQNGRESGLPGFRRARGDLDGRHPVG